MVTQIGYKASELGMIPHDWEVVELGDVGKTYGGLSGKNKSDFDKGNSFYVPFTNVMANLEVDKNQLGKVEVNEKQNAVLEGDLLFNGSSETPEEVCFASLVNFSLPNLFLNSFCFGFRLIKNTVHPKYLAYWFRSEIGRKTIAFMSQGSTRYNVSKSEFVKLKLVIPSKLEQTAIATALSDTDALISSLQTLITKKQAIKLSAMQNLLSGKIRLPEFAQCPDGSPKTTRQTELGLLPEDWKVVELREIGYFQSGVEFPLYLQGKKDGEYPVFKVSDLNNIGNEKFMSLSNNYIDEDVRKNIAGKIIPENAIIFAKIGAAIFLERKRINKYKSFIDNNMMAFIPCGNLSAEFLYFCFLQIKLGDMVEITALPALSSSRLKLFKIAIPKSTTEQTAIAQLLSDMDAEIEALECRLKKTQALKQGMMQALLTGKIRLPLE